MLAAIVAVSWIGMVVSAQAPPEVAIRPWPSFWWNVGRVGCGYFAGVLLYRIRDRLPVIRVGLVPIYLVLVAMLEGPRGWSEVYDPICQALMPVLVWAGVNARVSPWQERLAKRGGELSYPLYLVHFPVLALVFQPLRPEGVAARLLGLAAFLALALALAWIAWRIERSLRFRLARALAN